jgi:hypothetical protein
VPPVVITGRHRPHELVFLALALVLGLAYTLGAPPPQSAAAEMPAWLVDVWAAGLLVHGVTGAASVLLPWRRDRALWLEAGSMLIGFGALLLVGAAAFSYAGTGALLGGGLCFGWAVANLVRVFQIHRDLRWLS